MDDVPEHLDYPVHWEWPLIVIGVGLFGIGYFLHPWRLSYLLFLFGGAALGWARFLGRVAAQRDWEIARAELKRGEREYLWRAAYRWIKRKFG